MISIEHLCKTLLTCKDLPVNISKINNLSGDKFLQKDAVKIQLDKLNINDDETNSIITTNSNNSKILDNEIIIPTIKTKIPEMEIVIPSRSLLNYQENNIITNLPAILLDVFKEEVPELCEWTLYGFKNPESFAKSVLILHKVDFIIKGRYDRMSTVYTFKKEMGLQLPKYFKKMDYKEMKFKQSEMMKQLLSKDHHHSYDFMVLCADYCGINLFIIDILKNTFCEIKHKLLDTSSNKEEEHNYNNYFIIVKYINNTFLPLLSKKQHYVSAKDIELIKKHFADESLMTNIDYIPRNYETALEKEQKDNEENIIGNTCNTDKTDNTGNTCKKEEYFEEFSPIMPIEPLINLSTYDVELPEILFQNQEKKSKTKLVLKNVSSYSLSEIQDLAVKNGKDIKKNGKTKIVNKTKQEIYDELLLI